MVRWGINSGVKKSSGFAWSDEDDFDLINIDSISRDLQGAAKSIIFDKLIAPSTKEFAG
jgi:hypothetical protein